MIGFLVVGLFAVAVLVRWLSRRQYRLPPGPNAIPLLGSVHHLPLEFQEKTFRDWRSIYGDIIYLKIFRTPAIVINSLSAARDLLDKRSAKYSDRPRMVLLAELQGHDSSLLAMPYGDRSRKHRRWMHDGIGTKKAVQSYRPVVVREMQILLEGLRETPNEFVSHLYRYTAATLLEVTYGRRLMTMQDELIVLAERSTNATNECGTPGAMLVDFFPILKYIPTWVPGGSIKRKTLVCRTTLVEWRNRSIEMVKSDMASGTGSPCIVSSLLDTDREISQGELEDIKGLGVNLFGAGTETTYGTLVNFFLAMTRNPDVFNKAQTEIDRVVGRDRMPTFEDRETLPYLNAVLQEIYRWTPGLPLSVPHRVMTDDRYGEYDIPAGCTVMPNIWGMTRDTDYYEDPEEFRPERHLNLDGDTLVDDKQLPSSFVFGFGRRVCPGQEFADQALWLAFANIVASFDIRKPVDSEGREITPPAAFKPGFTIRPVPFKCTIVPREQTGEL